MAEGIIEDTDLYARIHRQYALPDIDLRSYSPLTLAYIGDGIYDLVIRSVVVGRGNTKASRLHQRTSRLVKAEAQSAMVDILLPLLTAEELAVYKRGRNAKSQTVPKHACASDYRRATGFEALMGWLYLRGQTKRLLYLTQTAVLGYEAAGQEAAGQKTDQQEAGGIRAESCGTDQEKAGAWPADGQESDG